ncbi:hypothetical protein E05_11210 [Plautia stali symbiont]|nr:hypothetical protein E05_11210 [Plautia stali symbiont]
MRYRIERIPEEEQHINFTFSNQRADLLIAAHRPAEHSIHIQSGVAIDQVAGSV